MSRTAAFFLLAICLGGCAVELRRPKLPQTHQIEPQLPEPTQRSEGASNAAPLRLLSTQTRGYIGRRLVRQDSNGELTEDPLWRWSSAPENYLDIALRFEIASNPAVRLVDAANVPTLAATLLTWELESKTGTQLVGEVEFQLTGVDRVVHTQVIRESQAVSAELPGNLSSAAGTLLHRLASEGIARMQQPKTN